MLDSVNRRTSLIALLVGMTVAGFVTLGLVQAAGRDPDLGESVVIPGSPAGRRTPSPPDDRTTSRPVPRKARAEPVEPPPPRRGGDHDDGSGDDD
jgi:hypothetical protein